MVTAQKNNYKAAG